MFTTVCDCDTENKLSTKFTLPHPKRTKEFPSEVAHLSPMFVKVYNQSLEAGELKLSELVGNGYRKAVEHLVWDFVSSVLKEQPKDRLSDIIKQLKLKDAEVEADLIRVIGNNETHVVKRINDSELGTDFIAECIDRLVLLIQLELKSAKNKVLLDSLLAKPPKTSE
jgi:hypothetical protein